MTRPRTQRTEISEDRDHQRHEWRIQRAGWALMVLLAVAALLGLLGNGPLSHASAGQPGALVVRYERLQRSGAPTEYRFQADPALVRDGQLRLRFDAALLDEVKLESFIPQPTQVRAGADHVDFVFAVDATPGAPAGLEMQFEPTTFGRVRGRITAAGAAPLVIDQFVFP